MSELRETIRQAMQGGGETPPAPEPDPTPAPAPIAEPTPAAAAATTPDPAAETAPKVEDPQGAAGDRDEKGRFKAKADNAAPTAEGAPVAATPQAEAAPKPETATPAEPGPQSEATRVPPALSAAVKAQWSDLPQAVRDEFTRLEGTFQKGKAEWEGKGQRLNRFDEIIGPRLARWQMAGVDEFQGIQMLLAAQDILDRDPVHGLMQVARSYGVTPAHLAQAFGLTQANGAAPAGAEGQAAPTGAPDITAVLQQALAPLMGRFQTLETQFQTSQQSAQSAETARIQAQIDAFANDPANLYFANVEPAMAQLIVAARAQGVELSMAQAYERAIWADPDIRPHLVKAQADAAAKAQTDAAEKARKEAEQAARDKAKAASSAAGSVTGGPTPGSEPPAGRSTGNLREDLIAARQQVAAQV